MNIKVAAYLLHSIKAESKLSENISTRILKHTSVHLALDAHHHLNQGAKRPMVLIRKYDNSCARPESFVRGVPTLTTFFFFFIL